MRNLFLSKERKQTHKETSSCLCHKWSLCIFRIIMKKNHSSAFIQMTKSKGKN